MAKKTNRPSNPNPNAQEIIQAIKNRSYAEIDWIADELFLDNDDVCGKRRIERILNDLIRQKKVIAVNRSGQKVDYNEYGYRAI